MLLRQDPSRPRHFSTANLWNRYVVRRLPLPQSGQPVKCPLCAWTREAFRRTAGRIHTSPLQGRGHERLRLCADRLIHHPGHACRRLGSLHATGATGLLTAPRRLRAALAHPAGDPRRRSREKHKRGGCDSFVTTEPAPTNAYRPMVVPHTIVQFTQGSRRA